MISVRPMHGIGDTLYGRPIVRRLLENAAQEVAVATPWPELYWDMAPSGLRFLNPGWTALRTQDENTAKQPMDLWAEPEGFYNYRLKYTTKELIAGKTPIQCYEKCTGLTISDFPGFFELPIKQEWFAQAIPVLMSAANQHLRVAVVRPPTLRKEWMCPSRNPSPAAWNAIMERIDDEYDLILNVGYLATGEEEVSPDITIVGNTDYLYGGLSIGTIAAICSMADLVVVPVCVMLPLVYAVGATALVVYGGMHGPTRLIDPRMRTGKVTSLAPKPFCECGRKTHDCYKHIEPQELHRVVESVL